MSNRIVAYSAVAALAAYAAAAAVVLSPVSAVADEVVAVSTVDRPLVAIAPTAADFAATQSPGTVGAMHYATAGQPTSASDPRLQAGSATAATVRWLPAPENAGS